MSHDVMQRIFSAEALMATGPFLAVSIGILVLIVLSLIPRSQMVGKLAFLGTLAVAAYYSVKAFQSLGSESRGAGVSVFEDTFVMDGATAAWCLIFLASTLVAWVFGQRFYREEADFEAEHDVLLLTALSGMMIMAGARDLLVFFVGLELLSVPLYALSGFRRARRESVEAGLKYFLLGAFAAATFLFGSALVYAGTGTVTLSRMHPEDLVSPLSIAGSALVVASLFFKVSVFPFHLWVPDVYQGSPGPVTTFMATGTKAAAFAFLLPVALILPRTAAPLISVIALLTMAAGNLGALVQTDMKRLLAYSGVAHAGTILLAIAGLLTSNGAYENEARQAILFYMAAYVFTAGGAFGILTLLESQTGAPVTLESLRGLGQRRPGAAAALALFMLSLGGIPATGGFLGKYLIFSVAVRSDMIAVAVIGVLMSVIALGYYLRVIIAIYMQPATSAESGETSPRPAAALATLVCAGMVLVLGVLPGWFLDHLR